VSIVGVDSRVPKSSQFTVLGCCKNLSTRIEVGT
jgi:hypothetical protein